MRIFAAHPKPVRNASTRSEPLKLEITMIMRINDVSNSDSDPINVNCREFKCKDTVVSLYDLVGGNLEVKLTGNRTYLGLPNRTLGAYNL